MSHIIDADPFSITFDRSEPPPGHDGHTGAPALRLTEIHKGPIVLISGMFGHLASHEVEPDRFVWMGGGHGYETESRTVIGRDGLDITVLSVLGRPGQDQVLASRLVHYLVVRGRGTVGLHITTTYRAYRHHRVRDIYAGMLPLRDANWTEWYADDLPAEVIDPPSAPATLTTPPCVGIGVQGPRADLVYLGAGAACVYMSHTVGKLKLYHRQLWQTPTEIPATWARTWHQALALRA